MLPLKNKFERIVVELPEGVKLLAISKFQPIEKLREVYSAGQRRFGESRADELAQKAAEMPADVEWHFIGHVQTNKARRVVAHADVVQSVDSERLLRILSAEAAKAGKTLKVMLQVHVAAEETKTGFLPAEIPAAARLALTLPAIEVIGIMGMASNTSDVARVREDFQAIARCGAALREVIPAAREVSMGMSGDWPIAVEEGATMVRIGSSIFGER